MKVDILIVLSSDGEFHPFISENHPKFKLPFLNVELLDLTLNYLAPCSAHTFIVCHESQSNTVVKMVSKRRNSIEVIPLKSFEGMSSVLNMMRKRISTNYFIMCKGDIYGLEPLNPVLKAAVETGDDLYCSVYKASKAGVVMCFDTENRLLMYNSKEFPFPKNGPIHCSIEYKLRDFFLVKTGAVGNFSENLFRFKDNVIPALIKSNKIIRLFENPICQITSMSDYMAQINFGKIHCHHDRGRNLIGPNCFIEDGTVIEDSVIGSSVIIGRNVIIKRCVIMSGAEIKPNCVIEDSVIGHHAIIHEKSYLKGCRVCYNYHILTPVTAEGSIFEKQ